MAYDVFLSYARQDTERAIQIKELLESLGLSVFFDTEGLDGGDVFPDVLDREVKTAGAVVGVWSKHAFTREWVKIECDIGRQRKVLVPVQIEDISFLDRPAAFHNIQYNDLSDFDGHPEHVGWLRFLRSLARVLDRPELLQREQAVQEATPDSDDQDVRTELAAMRQQISEMTQAKAALAASVQSGPPSASATNYAIWQELKQTGNVDAVRRFLETVRGTPLEPMVEAELARLASPEPADIARPMDPASPPPNSQIDSKEDAGSETKSGRKLIIGGLIAAAAAAGFGFFILSDRQNTPQGTAEAAVEVEAATARAEPAQTSTDGQPRILRKYARMERSPQVENFEGACLKGDGEACEKAGLAFWLGRGTEKPVYEVALVYFDQGCQLQHLPACSAGSEAAMVNGDYDIAEKYLQIACKTGTEEACASLEDFLYRLNKGGD